MNKIKPKNIKFQDFVLKQVIGTGFTAVVKIANFKDGKKLACKVISKNQSIKSRLTQKIINQIDILTQIKNPFIVELFGIAQDQRYIYIFQELLNGSQLYSYLKIVKRIQHKLTIFIASQVILCFQYLHSKNIIFRDLKPQNIILNKDAFIKLIDFGQAKFIKGITYTLCGTPQYLPPQIILSMGHGKPADWWTLGILIYQMASGITPFVQEDPLNIYQKILRGKIRFPKDMDPSLIKVIKGFLTANPQSRLGSGIEDVQQIKQEKAFSRIDWGQLYCRKNSKYCLNIQKQQIQYQKMSQQSDLNVQKDQDPFLDILTQ